MAESKTTRMYMRPYQFLAYRISDEYCHWTSKNHQCISVIIQGPIFPAVIDADFSNFKGFREFTERFGFEGLANLDPFEEHSLGQELKEMQTKKDKVISQKWLENTFERIKEKLLKEQRILRTFHKWFVKKEPPFGIAYDEWAITIASGAHPRLKDNEIIEATKTFREIYGAVQRNLRQAEIVPTFPVVPIDDVFELVSFPKKPPDKPGWTFHFPTIFGRCYMEMLDLIQDEVELIPCANCGRLFFPARKDEIFCSNLAPQYRTWTEKGRKTCKKVGPQLRFKKKLEESGEIELVKEKKRFLNRLYYLESAGKKEEYEKTKKDYEHWRKEKSHGMRTN